MRWCVVVVLAACKGSSAPPPAPAPAPAPTPAPPTAVAAPAAGFAVVDITGKPLPAGVNVRGGKVLRAVTFTDKNGPNYLVFSMTDTDKPRTRVLYIDHWLSMAMGDPRPLLPARDLVEDCVMGALLGQFVDGAFGVTDLDHDGIAEVTYGYQLACRSDVSSATYKLLLVEDGVKYILRGHSRVQGDSGPTGGDFVPEPAPTSWPAGFYEHATALWNKTANDLEDPPR